MAASVPSRFQALIVLVVCLTFVSIPVLHKYAGIAGTFACLLFLVSGVTWWCRAAMLVKAGNLSATTAMLIMAGLLLVMWLLFLLIYPAVNTAQPGRGSDRDDALNMTVLIVPLYLFDPAAFTPLHVAGKLQQFNAVLPYAEFWLPAILILVSLVAAAGANAGNVLFRLALVLAVPVVAAAALDSLSEGRLSGILLAHGLNFMFFGIGASCAALLAAPATASARRATVA